MKKRVRSIRIYSDMMGIKDLGIEAFVQAASAGEAEAVRGELQDPGDGLITPEWRDDDGRSPGGYA